MTRPRNHFARTPWLFLAPFLTIFGVFTAYPFVQSMFLSMRQTFGPGTSAFVGAANYRAIASDPLFWKALTNTALYTAASVFIQLPLALGLAMLLNSPRLRGRAVLRMIFFAPSLVGVVFVAMMFTVMFDKRTGIINVALHRCSSWTSHGVEWLASLFIEAEAASSFADSLVWSLDFAWLQDHVLIALVVASLWMWVGFNMIYFLAALQNVSAELNDAALVDGASRWQRFQCVVLPAIRPVAGFVVLLSIVGSFQVFELPWILLNNTGGPDNRGLTVVTYLYQTGFQAGDLGYASAIGWVLAIILIVCASLQRLSARGEVVV